MITPLSNATGITTRMARTFLPGVQDLVGSCRQTVIDHGCCCSASAPVLPTNFQGKLLQAGLFVAKSC